MPALVAVVIRGIIQAVVTTGILTAVQTLLIPLLNKAITEVAEFYGATEQEAQDIVANQYLQFAETAGILLVTIRTKTPTLIAERLGFTAKGFVLRKLSPTLAARVGGTAIASTATAVATTAEVTALSTTLAKVSSSNAQVVSSLFNSILKVVGVSSGVLFAVGGFIDFANWQGAYQKTFQSIFSALGFPPDTPMPKAKSVSADTWSKIYTVVEELNPQSIAFPWDNTVKPYSRANLADAVDHFAANLALQGQQATWKTVWALLLPCIKIGSATSSNSSSSTSSSSGSSSNAGSSSSSSTSSNVKVFTGIVSQGVLGNGLQFVARQDDLIENMTELQDAAQNNLAPFLASIASRVRYELKVVTSVVTKDGFKQTGKTQQIQNGTYKNGTPKYKSVTNKFAVLDIFITNDKGSRVSLTRIVLGPTDAARFVPTNDEVKLLQDKLPSVVTTQNISEVNTVKNVSGNAVTIHNAETAAPVNLMTNNDTINQFNKAIIDNYRAFSNIQKQSYEAQVGVGMIKGLVDANGALLNGKETNPISVITQYYGNISSAASSTTTGAGTTATTAPPAQRAGANSTTLREWYEANGQSLPTIEARSVTYENYGLGKASYYTGTTEQNAKLLDKLKGF